MYSSSSTDPSGSESLLSSSSDSKPDLTEGATSTPVYLYFSLYVTKLLSNYYQSERKGLMSAKF